MLWRILSILKWINSQQGSWWKRRFLFWISFEQGSLIFKIILSPSISILWLNFRTFVLVYRSTVSRVWYYFNLSKNRSYLREKGLKGYSRIRSQDQRKYDILPQREPPAKRCATSSAPNKKGGKQWKLEFLPFSSSDDKVVVSVISLIRDHRDHLTLAMCGRFLSFLGFRIDCLFSMSLDRWTSSLNFKSLAMFV